MASRSTLPLEHMPGNSLVPCSSPSRGRNFACRSVSVRMHRVEALAAWISCRADHKNASVTQFNVPLLSGAQVMEELRAFELKRNKKPDSVAMYSSIFGGITTDLAAMVVPLDDHIVHRGHGVFDTAAIMDGYLYELDQHLDRFLRSASMAKINPPFYLSSIRNILIQTVSASKCSQGSLRYWLSAGPGDFNLSPSGCLQSSLYAIAYDAPIPEFLGARVITSSIPIKSPKFAIMKSVNYLPNALTKMEAEENGAFAGIWLDDEGYVAEGPNMNVAFVTGERELLMPQFEKILSGCTARRVLALAEKLVKEGTLAGIRIGKVTVQEGKMANEMMLIGSGIIVKPVLQWDEQLIGEGKEGPIAEALFNLILEDMRTGPPSVRVQVPY
ncbi:Branched-chain-amino-acid aminotransferase-like protein 3, chloroplastic [Apostasia shenzhenica]|uniref:Branched-chain-amino-acid aminotransferase-like protein 3, chloroplastic n=1 Tax=Apostasia shenzhenica TaxID=1088818 RepID=A0A2I0BAC4_9ASPA|nr:Branched-chain-amino-acid aminotransferase-like protein 3, chloroplastic [Apostasia shenzhenica]